MRPRRSLPYRLWQLLAALILLGGSVLLIRQWFPELNREALISIGEELPGSIFLGAFLLLPLLGVPISIFLVAAGLKYGTLDGMLVATVATGVHNLVAYGATKGLLQNRIENILERLGYGIPQIPGHHQWWFTAIFVGVPGLPYAIKLYSLALTNITFRIYFWIGWPLYAVSCIVYVFLGAAAATLNIGWFIAAILLGVALMFVMKWLCKKAPPAAPDPETLPPSA